ncbi:MAG: hypothetical protein VB050_12715 [Geobacteraceae bacterium]|nr:hypothetical protein [Geobacteraceae bacterium]
MKKDICFFVMAMLIACSNVNAMEFTLITKGGYVTFAAGDNWGVVTMETKKPNQTAAFQVPMSGEVDSAPPTNVSIILINPKLPETANALDSIGRSYGPSKVTEGTYNKWSTYRQVSNDSDGILFTIVDAKREIADVVVWVRFAWPKNKNNEAEPIFYNFLNSIRGDFGKYKTRDGEIIRRPIN